MLLVPDITAGTGTESDETPGWWWPVGLSQSEGAHETVVSVDGSFSECPAIWEFAGPRSTRRQVGGTVEILVRTAALATFRQAGFSAPDRKSTRPELQSLRHLVCRLL